MYKIIGFPSPGIMRTTHFRYGEQLWTLVSLTKKHKNDNCAVCELSVGDLAFRPMTNLGNRMVRICRRHLDSHIRSILENGFTR